MKKKSFCEIICLLEAVMLEILFVNEWRIPKGMKITFVNFTVRPGHKFVNMVN